MQEFTKSAFKFKDKQIYLAKCTEPLPIRWSRQIPESCEPSTVTVRLHPSGRWHISIRFDDPTIKPLPPTDKAIGIDLGISSLVITSDGDKVSNPKHFNKHYRRLRRASKNLSRKQKGSKNREKARIKVAKIHALDSPICRFTHSLEYKQQVNPLLSIHNYTPLVISRNAKNKERTLLSQRKLALIERNTLFAI